MAVSTPLTTLETLRLETTTVGRRIVVFDAIDSTNTYALEHGEDGMVVVADRQTAGRGRLGRRWLSEPGLGLWFTVVLNGPGEGLTSVAALAVKDALKDRCALRIKWPNDLLLDGKKVCGILVELRNERIALGIGLNVHHRTDHFPAELRDKAGSLEAVAGGEWDRVDILRRILIDLDQKIMLMRTGGFDSLRERWAAACELVGRSVRVDDRITGVVKEIDGAGALVLKTADGMQRIHSGDITIQDPA